MTMMPAAQPPVSVPEAGRTPPEISQLSTAQPIPLPKIEEIKPLEYVEAPAPVAEVAETPVVKRQKPAADTSNLYDAGNCTWYAKSLRPDIPNNLGNADTWAIRAQAQGFIVSNQPKIGAVAQKNMHVVYVTAVQGDTFTLTEMNHRALHEITSRTVPAAGWKFIY